jgi:sulfotransferase family protein
VSGDEEIARLERELSAVDAERLRLRSELEQVRLSPLGPLIGPARTARSVVERWLRRLSRRLPFSLRRAGGRRRQRAARLPPRLSGSELAWLTRQRLRRGPDAWDRVEARPPSAGWLTPILVDSFGRDASTLMMALLATSPEIVVERKYPYERRYFTYLWRWSRLLSRTDWPAALWGKEDVAAISQEHGSTLLGPPPWLPRGLFEPASGDEPISRRCFELAWVELSARAIERARAGGEVAPRYCAEKHANTWLVDEHELPPIRKIVLLRDPRDTQVSISGFEAKEPATRVAIDDAWRGADRLDGILARHRDRLRWIAGLLDEGRVPVVRYEDLVSNLGGAAARISEYLGVELAPDSLAADELAERHRSSADGGLGRWRDELDAETADRFRRELGPELRAVGFEA